MNGAHTGETQAPTTPQQTAQQFFPQSFGTNCVPWTNPTPVPLRHPSLESTLMLNDRIAFKMASVSTVDSQVTHTAGVLTGISRKTRTALLVRSSVRG